MGTQSTGIEPKRDSRLVTGKQWMRYGKDTEGGTNQKETYIQKLIYFDLISFC